MSTENTVFPCSAEHASRFSEASRFAERRANQQRILAQLGMRALSGASLDDLMAAIPRWVCDSLGTQYCNIFQMLSGEERLLLRASCGLTQAQVGKATISMTKHTQSGYTVANDQPVVVEDFASETRFERPKLDICDRVTSGMSVTIFQSKARPWGMLTACARERMAFSADDVSFFQGVANMLGMVLERFRQEEERNGLEAALRKAEGRVRVIVDSALDGIILMDATGHIESANPAAVHMFGYELKDLVGRRLDLLIPESSLQKGEECANDDIRKGIKRIVGKAHEVVGRRNNSSLFALDLAVAEAVNDHSGFIGTMHDLTERKQLQEQLLHAQKMDSIGRLAGGVAHDYNNLLAIIIGFGELVEKGLEEAEEPSTLLKKVKNMMAAAEKAAALTAQLLAFASKQAHTPRIMSANSLLEEVSQLLRPLIGAHIELITLFHEEDGRVFIDPGQLEQVMVNLAVNARDAMPQGGKLILRTENLLLTEAYITDKSAIPPGAYVVVSVTDSGTGMSREVKARLFEPFFTTKEPGKGTGLGLATVYGIVHQANGHIYVYSEEGVGTTFKVYLPRQEGETIGAKSKEDELQIRGDELVLVVEDEPLVRELMVGALELNGYTVMAAENGQHALRVLAEAPRPPDLLITDATMPLMGGRELIKRFREIHPTIPVIISSGYSEGGWATQPEMLPNGISFIQKPFTGRTLLEHVRYALDIIGQPLNI